MARLVVISEPGLQAVMTAIVTAAHTATDTLGQTVQLATIDPALLRTAAKVGLEIAIRETVWCGGDELELPEPKRQTGLVRMRA